MEELELIITVAWDAYSNDSRLNDPPFEGSVQRAPDDLGAFKSAMIHAEEVREHYIIRCYRHYQNELNLAGKPKQQAFESGIRLGYAELGASNTQL